MPKNVKSSEDLIFKRIIKNIAYLQGLMPTNKSDTIGIAQTIIGSVEKYKKFSQKHLSIEKRHNSKESQRC